MDDIAWIQNWFHQHCDGDWEHNENINIHTIDNPGWRLTIDLEGTSCENNFFQNGQLAFPMIQRPLIPVPFIFRFQGSLTPRIIFFWTRFCPFSEY